MMMIEKERAAEQGETDLLYSLFSPLWDMYYRRTRKSVRFPRNYREVSALADASCLKSEEEGADKL